MRTSPRIRRMAPRKLGAVTDSGDNARYGIQLEVLDSECQPKANFANY